MKKRFMVCVLALVCAVLYVSNLGALAASIDFTAMTDDELVAVIADAQAELNARKGTAGDEGLILYDSKGIKWYIVDYEESWGTSYSINTVIENNSGCDIIFDVSSMSINGWDISVFVYSEVGDGKKAKEELWIDLEEAELSSLADISTMEISIDIFKSSNYSTIAADTVTVVPAFK